MRVLCAIALSFTAVVASTVRNGERLTQPVNDGEEHGVLTTRYEMFDYKPKAQDLATVVTSDGGVRITVLTDRLIRIEQGVKDEDCDCYTFEDRPSVAAVNRHLKVPKFETTDNGTTLSLTSDQWEITHVIGSDLDDPTGQSIKVTHTHTHSPHHRQSTKVTHTHTHSPHHRQSIKVQAITGDQLIQWDSSKRSSKDSVGGALLDDSDGPVMDEKDWWTDKSGKAYTRRNKVDWYLFLHGLDYTGAIFDYTQVFGRTSLLPKYSLGTWFTRLYTLHILKM
ncbi:hypothetical protein SARC_01866 [Sphaeroforma arctica JP610]|uniref:Uncharacterized protein n=1 Tax=Sphaeroforma arctica JP610 TaxID=667725 RepID=A0A0L0GAN5_9EUKA|nr:hypothetical protein SARC_01866 [Sphaeroforma arctica JP610]KNC85961.1 hypothetical protein SARC_01866 [Sphaeroforma arctica JP610]|eukprot:XP_014159863.1 hypothetical protein SARC_01866 [Sphaeroforma arctica JP610]